MLITVTYDLDEDKIKTIEDILSWYGPSDFKNQDDREVFLDDIAFSLTDIYSTPLSWETIVEEYLKEKGWI